MKEKPLFFVLIILTLLLFVLSLSVGKVSISFTEIFNVFSGHSDEMLHNLVLNFRLPKSLTALLVGVSLPISGFLMQELFKNPLAEPSVLGITSMASLGVAIVIFLFSMIGILFQILLRVLLIRFAHLNLRITDRFMIGY